METTSNPVICKKGISARNGISRFTAMRKQNDLEALLSQGVFHGFSVRDIRRLCKAAKKGSLKRYELLLQANEHNQSLFLITKGACLTRRGKSFFAEIDQGYFVGEMSFLTGNPVSVDVVARSETEYLQWDKDHMDRMLGRRSRLRARFYSLLGTHMANRLCCITEKLIAA